MTVSPGSSVTWGCAPPAMRASAAFGSPWLPVPDPAMLEFRTTTQYGDASHELERDDLVAWLRWCKAENQRRRVV